MAAAQKKNTYTSAEVAVLEETILKQQDKIEELKRKQDHMNEVLPMPSVLGLVSPARRLPMS